MRRGRHAAETGSHPFRSLFDLMLALVLLLLAAFVLRRPKTQAVYDVTYRREELLLLHNLRIRQERGDNALLLTNLRQTAPDDFCRRIAERGKATLSEKDKQDLEVHRDALWRQVAPTVRARLLAPRITRIIDQNKLQFPPGSAVPTEPSRLPSILASAVTQCYDEQRTQVIVKR